MINIKKETEQESLWQNWRQKEPPLDTPFVIKFSFSKEECLYIRPSDRQGYMTSLSSEQFGKSFQESVYRNENWRLVELNITWRYFDEVKGEVVE